MLEQAVSQSVCVKDYMLTVGYLCSSRRVRVFLEADCPHGSVIRQRGLLSNKDSLSVGVTRREHPLAAAQVCGFTDMF